jgi:hypothetical protein
VLAPAFDGTTGTTTASIWLHRPGIGLDDAIVHLTLEFAVAAHESLNVDGTYLSITMSNIYVFPVASPEGSTAIDDITLTLQVQEPHLQAFSVVAITPSDLNVGSACFV